MKFLSPHRSLMSSAWLSAGAGLVTFFCGSWILISRLADLPLIENWIPGNIAMNGSTGFGLAAAGLALLLRWLQARLTQPTVFAIVNGCAKWLAIAVILLGGWNLLLDLLVANDISARDWLPELIVDTGLFNQRDEMAPLTAFCFVLTGASLLWIDKLVTQRQYPSEYLALMVGLTMSVPIIGYLYSLIARVYLETTVGIPPQLPMLFFILMVGILGARPTHALMSLWNSAGPGGVLMRRLLPKSLGFLIVLDFVVKLGEYQRWYSDDKEAPLIILLSSAMLIALFFRAAAVLNREHEVRRKGESALAESNALLRAVSDNTPDGIFVKDPAGRTIFANPALLRLLERDASTVIGRHSADLYADTDYARLVDANDRDVMRDGVIKVFEANVNFAHGMRTLHSTNAPWFDEHGNVIGLVGINTDITERKRIEDTLKAHESQLEQLVAARTAEVSELIGHLESTREEEKRAIARELHDDLGSSLTALSMHLAILFQQLPPEPRLAERAQQIKTLLNTITNSTRRIQIGLRPDKLDIFGIKTALTELAAEFEKYSGVTCKVSLPDEELNYPANLNIAIFRMTQEALNNVAKHAKATRVNLVIDDVDDELVITIRDDGVGIDTPLPGARITHGLRGMRERAGYLGGQVKVNSTVGSGTTITITLPKQIASMASVSKQPEVANNSGFASIWQADTLEKLT